MLRIPPEVLGPLFGASELLLTLFKRSRGGALRADRGSLRVLWIVIVGSIVMGGIAAQLLPQATFVVLLQLRGLAAALFAAGLALRWYAIVHLGRFFTVDVAIAADHQVIDTGPYRLIRHPSYTGALLALLGLGLSYGNVVSLLVLVVPTTAVFLHRIAIEEQALVAGLGVRYEQYRRRTRRLVPWVY
jgi:protein-S-isoprenylcysteine O-methyltransferase